MENIPNYEGDFEQLQEDLSNYGYITLDCGCNVEPDGDCEHGNQSPLLEMGLI